MPLKILHKPLRYLLGKKNKRKLIVFESDDWGSIRMPNKKVRDILAKKIPQILNDPYSYYDTLESYDDISALTEVLIKHKNTKGQKPILTVNTILTNPAFQKIKEDNFSNYYYETFEKTILRYYGEGTLKNWFNAVEEKLFYPQLHGREHVHVLQWLQELKINKNLNLAFNYETYSIPVDNTQGYKRKNLLSSLNLSGLENEDKYHADYLTVGYNLFKDIFGYASESFIATKYVWNEQHEQILSSLGVKYLQGIGYQYMPINRSNLKKKFHYTGQKNKFGQYYLVRNAFFEPSIEPNKDWVDECLSRIELAFKFKKPAIIGTHRVNFIGSIEESNRTKNLKLFDKLLQSILKKWPDVEFTTSDKILGNYII